MADSLDFEKIEEVTPDEILAEYASAGEDYAIQNEQVEEGA
jgi:hypothetical protein